MACFNFEWGISRRFKSSCITDGFCVSNHMSFLEQGMAKEREEKMAEMVLSALSRTVIVRVGKPGSDDTRRFKACRRVPVDFFVDWLLYEGDLYSSVSCGTWIIFTLNQENVWSALSAQYGVDQAGKVANPARGQLNREMDISLSPFTPENLVSRDGFGCLIPRQLAQWP